jgi:hypothetical protein
MLWRCRRSLRPLAYIEESIQNVISKLRNIINQSEMETSTSEEEINLLRRAKSCTGKGNRNCEQ